MNVFTVAGDIDFGVVHQNNDEALTKRLEDASGKPAADGWDLVEFFPQIYRGKPIVLFVDALKSAAPVGSGLLISHVAKSALAPVIGSCGEFLPVVVGGHRYDWFNCLAVLDGAVDSKKTLGVRWKYGDLEGWESVERWEFIPDLIEVAPAIFRVPDDPYGRLFCTDVLATAIADGDLVGFDLMKVWSSDAGGVPTGGMLGPHGTSYADRHNDFTPSELRQLVNAKRKAAAAKLSSRDAEPKRRS